MPLRRLEWVPGFNSQATQTRNKQGWFAGNLVRWRYGLLEKVAGWQQLFSTTVAGIARAIHAYEDLLLNINLIIAGDGGAQIYISGTLYTLEFSVGAAYPDGTWTATTNAPSKSVTINQANFGALQVGSQIITQIIQSIGGVIVPTGTTLTVTGITPQTDYTFNLPSAATISGTQAFTVPLLSFNSGSTIISVNLPNHGLITGDSFTFDVETFVQFSSIGDFIFLDIPGGTVVTITVTDSDDFTFDGSPFGIWNTPANGLPEGINETTIDGGTHSLNYAAAMIYVTAAPSPPPETWWLDNFGTDGVINYTNGPIFIYTPPISTGQILTNAGVPNPAITGSGAPQINTGVFVAMPQAQLIAFGSEVILGGGVQDPLLVRFSDAGSTSSWTATASNQAGSFHLGGSGTKIVGGFQAPQTTLLWTDNDFWSMIYEGPPFIYGFTILASQCGLIAPHAFALMGRTTLWMSRNSFFTFSDSGATPIECPLWDDIFLNLNQTYLDKVFIGASQSTNEFWVFYPSLNSTGECDSYVKLNILENFWDPGSLNRSAWIAENAFGTPLGAEWNTLLIQQHEIGYDANGVAMAGVYAETGYADLADGEEIMFVNEFLPDMKWFGVDGAVSITFKSVMYPGSSPTTNGPITLDSTNRYIRPRIRARQIALRFDWAARLGQSARLGTPRARVAPAGSRP